MRAKKIIITAITVAAAIYLAVATQASPPNDEARGTWEYDTWADCTTGPGVGTIRGCEPFDYDHDVDVDLMDYAIYQRMVGNNYYSNREPYE